MGINKFTGLTDVEFVSTYLSPRPNPNLEVNLDVDVAPADAEIDWAAKGMVSRIKDQGNCGSCWAFSATGVIESWALMKGLRADLSEQQLVDCSRKYGNFGCSGGFNYQGLAYVKDHGIDTEANYPYKGHNQGCKHDGGDFKISKVATVTGCSQIASAIQIHPIGVSADATNWSKYSSGIFNNCKRDLNHDILLVGLNS
jgi:C1A family cysteine protease